MMQRIRRTWQIIGLGLALFSFAPAASAGANAFGPAAEKYLADSLDHWYCFSPNIPLGDVPSYMGSMSYLDDTTDLYDVFTSTCGNATDIVYALNNGLTAPSGGPSRGVAVCATVGGLGTCDQFWVVINNAAILVDTSIEVPPSEQSLNYSVNLVKTIRHETGHTTGLQHGGTSGICSSPSAPCDAMVTGWVPTNVLWGTYGGHHVGHINAQYY